MIKASEISEIIKRQLAGYEAQVDLQEVGRVIEAGDGISRVYGLEKRGGRALAVPLTLSAWSSASRRQRRRRLPATSRTSSKATPSIDTRIAHCRSRSARTGRS